MIKRMLYVIAYFISMPVVVLLAIFGYHFYKNNLMIVPHPSKTQLEISEIAYKSKEVMTIFWWKYHKCPTLDEVKVISELSLVAKVNITQHEADGCKLVIELKKELMDKNVAGKAIEQVYNFEGVPKQNDRYQWQCYADLAAEVLPYRCKKIRDIEFYLKSSYL